MKYAIVDYFGYDLTPRQRMRAIRLGGFDAVILLWADDFDPDYRDFPRYAQDEGLQVENTHGPYLGANDIWLPGGGGEAYTAALLNSLEDCARFQIPTMVVHPVNGRQPLPEDPSLGLARFARVLRQAEDCGVNLAMENQGNPDYLDFCFRELSSPRLKFCFDSGHEHYYSPNRDLLKDYGHLLCALHLHDNDGARDAHALPFTGTVDWRRLRRRLKEIGYMGPLSLEAQNEGFTHITDPATFTALARERLRQLEELI